ncbi:diguanylate cyclase [Acidobacteriota bacterium]
MTLERAVILHSNALEHCSELQINLRVKGFDVHTISTIDEIGGLLEQDNCSCILVHVDGTKTASKGSSSGLALILKIWSEINPDCPVIGFGPDKVDAAVLALRHGALYYIAESEVPEKIDGVLIELQKASPLGEFKKGQLREITFFNFLHAVSATLKIERLINLILDSSMEILRAGYGSLVMMNESGKALDLTAMRGPDGERGADPYLGLAPASLAALLERTTSPDLAKTARASGEILGSGHVIGVPMRFEQGLCGLMLLGREKADSPCFTYKESTLASKLAAEASKAVSNCVVLEKATTLAMKDDLTDAYNRRYLEQTVREDLERIREAEGVLAVIFMDLDDLKSVNINHGHIMGSKVIQELAHRIILALRGEDRVIRYGGDEFCLILPYTAKAAAMEVAERLRRTIKDQPFLANESIPVHLTASFGVATFPEDASTLEGLIKKADRAMLAAKSGGKDGITSTVQ